MPQRQLSLEMLEVGCTAVRPHLHILEKDIHKILGMAVRLSADLGLHLDLSSHVQEGRLTARALDVRRTAFWGVFIHDKYVLLPS